MRKFASVFLFALLTWLSGTALAVFNGPEIPLPLPLTQDGKTYNAYVQTWHPHYRESRICYYSNDFNQSYTPVIAKSDATFGFVNVNVLLNPASFNQVWDSVAYNSTNVLCALYYNGSWSSPATPNSLFYALYSWNDWYFNSDPRYQYDHDLNHNVRAVGIDVKINTTYDFQAQFFLGSYTAGDVVIHRATPLSSYFSFPLEGETAYSAPISAVMDHSMGLPYAEDGIVLAFSGEQVDRTNGFRQGCYKRTENLLANLTYVGTRGTGGPAYLCYDGHPGYDYPKPRDTNILAPANGKLCIATKDTTIQSPASVWRNQTECGDIPNVVITRWIKPPIPRRQTNYNTFYIFHREHINGTTDDYMTVFLHSNSLENSVWSEVASRGYANVTRGQHIAYIGNVGTVGYHLHLETYKKDTEGSWVRVDPYGNGVNNILWQR